MNLADAFSSIVVKELVLVDIPHRGSNQHEFNGTKALRAFFKTPERLKTRIQWHYFGEGREIESDEGSLTFYDSRKKSTDRTGRIEWRGYYTGDFLSKANVGDVLILAKAHDGDLHGMIFEAGSNWLRSVSLLLKLRQTSRRYSLIENNSLQASQVDLAEQLILEELGFAIPLVAPPDDQELMIKTFGKKIPNTRTLAQFARGQVQVDPTDADNALVKWIERETALFYAIERVLVQERIDRGFESVEDFLEYSISIQQSRKSRMGLSLQHHLGALFTANGLRFTAQARTEGKNRPDFLFPSEADYQNPNFDSRLLIMLGAKSTVKERWRQILAEADRVKEKHLCTLEPGISSDQTDEMGRHQVRLVLPSSLHSTYAPKQLESIWDLRQFVGFVRRTQR